ncbi:MAG: hypothetical protein P1V51_11000 [Deltaproteobacteria bacterium]|nr:hypothetical protein [Deltaproteobacteria bacterium]
MHPGTRTCLLTALLFLSTLASAGCPKKGDCEGETCSDAGFCLEDRECAGGEICEQGVCVPARDGPCSVDTDCRAGERCEALTGKCVSTTGCTSDAACGSLERCDLATGTCIGDPGCTRDLDCSPPQTICEGGACVPGCAQSGCSGTDTCEASTGRCQPVGGCSTDAQCSPPARICEGGACVPGCGDTGCSTGWTCLAATGRCESDGSCTSDAECGAPARICHSGSCIDGCTPGGCGTEWSCNTSTGRCESGTGGCISDANCSPPAAICVGGSCTAGCTTTGCTTGTCNTSTGRCGTATTTCSTNADCSAPFPLCAGGTCVADGSSDCTTTGCTTGSLCDPYLGACEPRGTVPLGQNCTTHEQCADDYCVILGDGQGRCTRACSATHQCPVDFNCYAIPPPGTSFCLHETLIGKDYGPSPMGTACSGTVNTCQSGMCLTLVGACTDSCQHDRDCLSGDACTLLIGDFDGNYIDEVRTICFPRGFGGTTGDACSSNDQCMRGNCMGTPPGSICADPCCKSTDCPTGFTCQPVQRPGAEGLFRACGAMPPTGTAPVGSPCNRADHTPCRSAWCFEDKTGAPPYCTDTCCSDADCPSGFRCLSELFDVDGDSVFDVSQPLCQRR